MFVDKSFGNVVANVNKGVAGKREKPELYATRPRIHLHPKIIV